MSHGLNPIRVLLVIDSLEVGGAQHHLLSLASRLLRLGHQPVIATSGQEPMAAQFSDLGITVKSLSKRSIKHRLSPAFTTRLTQLAITGAFDLIHAHLFSSSAAASVAARVTGRPLIVTHHSMNTWQRGWQRALGSWVDGNADAVIAVASSIAASRKARRIYTIPNGVAVPDRTWSGDEIAAARKKLGIPTNAFVMSYVGRFTADKNPLLFIDAVALLAERVPGVRALLIGDGPLRKIAERRAEELDVRSCMSFLGFQPDAHRLHSIADVLVLTSESEGSPLVVLEAMAAGRPVVATDVGDVAQQIVHGESGYLVSPREPEAVAKALLELQDPARRAQMGSAGRLRVLQEFNMERTLDQIVEVYRLALHQTSLRAVS